MNKIKLLRNIGFIGMALCYLFAASASFTIEDDKIYLENATNRGDGSQKKAFQVPCTPWIRQKKKDDFY